MVADVRKDICFVIGSLPERVTDVLGVNSFFL